MNALLEILSFEFVERALIVGVMAGVIAGVLGAFVVSGRNAIFSDMLAHTSLAGVGIGLFLGISPTYGALGIAILSTILLWGLLRRRQYTSDAISMMLLSGGLSLALIFAHFAKNTAVSFETFLFGSILTIRESEVWIFACVALAIGTFLFLFGNRLRSLVLDPAYAESRFPTSTSWIELGFLISIATLVAFSLKIVGGLLIGALLVIPVVTAQTFCNTFRSVIVWSVLFNIVAVLIGIGASFWFDLPTGAAIVLTLIVLLLCTVVIVRK